MKRRISILLVALSVSMLLGCTAPREAAAIRLEHVALNVQDPVAMANWYCENLDMKILRRGPEPVNNRFIADADGNMMLELYNTPPDKVPDYRAMDPLTLHIAFTVPDVPAVRRRLLEAGATSCTDLTTTPAGDVVTILRDPWGVPIQFITRAQPMLK
ncbi:MAG: VOC family protein [Sedimentisphaerales bacterium]|nr:VOC family protein [Sedimentisphaerales bacterium]